MKKLLILVDGSQIPAGGQQQGTRAEVHGCIRSSSSQRRKNWGHDTPSLTARLRVLWTVLRKVSYDNPFLGMTTLFGAILVSRGAIEIVTDLA